MALKVRDLLFIISMTIHLLVPGYSAVAAPGDITTVAGGAVGDGGPATDAFMRSPFAVATDASGNIFIADTDNHRIRKIDAGTGIITTIAGNGECSFSGDNGPSTASRLCSPQDIAVDLSGNIFIADVGNNRIRKIDGTSGIIGTVAGNGHAGFSGDGVSAIATSIYYPSGVFVDSAGNIFISDRNNMRIRKVDTGGIITTVAGNGLNGFGGDGGLAANARFSYPSKVTVDSLGNIYVADEMNNRIRKITAETGIITTIAGDGNASFSGDGGSALLASLNRPTGVTVDSAGSVYIADIANQRIRKVSSGVITTIAGNGTYGFSGDGGLATNAGLHYAYSVFVLASGDLLIPDSWNGRIRRVDSSTGLINTIAGKGWSGYAGDGGPAASATLYNPEGVVLNAAGDMYIADSLNHRIRKVDHTSGTISTVVGNGIPTFAGDNGPALSASLNSPTDVFLDGSGNMFIADTENNRIRKVTAATGAISTVAGNGAQSFGGDNGPAVSARLNHPQGVFVDASGNMYIADAWNHRVRKVNASTGIITTVAGNGSAGYAGDEGAAVSASLNLPHGLVADAAGNIYIADTYNHRVRKVDAATGTITTVAGNGASGCSGNGGPPTNAALFQPAGVTLDAAGNLYIAEWGSTVRKIDQGAGIIVTIAGTCYGAFGGDGGPATEARLSYPSRVSMDRDGNIIIADRNNNRIRRVEASPDNIPDRFTFTDLMGVALNTQFTSNSVVISGLTVSVPVSISGGEYSVNGGPFTTASGMVHNGDTISVRSWSGSSYGTTTDAVLTVGMFSDVFSLTTLDDSVPDPFSFADVTDAPLNTLVISSSITVTGITAMVPVTIFNGEYEMNATGVWTSDPGYVWNGVALRVRQISSSNLSTTTDTMVTIGGISDTFSVTTAAVDSSCAAVVSRGTSSRSSINDLGEVVWSQFDPATGYQQVYSSMRGHLTNDQNDHINPSVNNRGDVVWEQNGQIYGTIFGQLVQFTYNGGDQPSINDSGEVVWQQNDFATGRLQIYSNLRGRLTSDATDHYNSSINNRGDVVWEQYDGNYSQIYGVISGVTATITTGQAWHMQPSISNSGEVVWSQGSLDSNNSIYSSTRGQLTFGCPSGMGHLEPSVNACGDLTFTNFENTGPIVYRLGNSAPCVSDPEPNDSMSQATLISGNSTTTGMMLDSATDMEDWYTFTANAGDLIKISVNWSPAVAPNFLDVSLTDTGGMVLVTAPEAGSPKTITTLAPLSGTYHVHLAALSGSRIGYNLSVKVGTGSGACADPVSPGQNMQSASSINDLGEVVWSQFDPGTGHFQIYSATRGYLTNDSNDHWNPSLNNRGDIVWAQNGQVYGIISDQLIQLTYNGGDQPSINDSGEVVWQQNDFATGRMQIYSNLRGRLTSDATDHYNPSINNRGDVVWEQYDGNYSQIYGIINGVPAQITTSQAWHMQPSIGNSGEVVWSQGSPGSNNYIYSSTRGQLTFGCPSGMGHNEPSVNACGDLTFTNFENTGPIVYRLGNNFPCVSDPEPNDSMSQATLISGNSTTTGMVDSATDREDWYSFTANAGDEIKISVNWNSAPQTTFIVELTNSSGVLAIAPEAGSPKTITMITPATTGTHYVHLMAISGNRIGYNLSVKVNDITPPTVSINPVITPTKDNSQTISGTMEAGAVVAVSINATAVAGPVMYPTATTWNCLVSGLSEAPNGITVTATDSAGNSSIVTTSIVVDTVAPNVTVSSPVAGISNVNAPLLSYIAEPGVVDVKVDGVSVAQRSGQNLNVLADGSHTVRVESTDSAGNVGFAEVTFVVDTVPPAVGINPVNTPTNLNTQTIIGTRENGAIVAIALNTLATAGTVSYSTDTSWSCAINGLVEGVNIVTVTATDAAGNSALVATSITYDSVAPTVVINSPSSATANNNKPILGYTASDGAVVVKVDGTNVPKISGDTLDQLADGVHTVRVEATDQAGNTGYAEVTFIVDTVPPMVTVNPVTSPTRVNTQTIGGDRESGALVTVSVDSSAAVGSVVYPTDATWSSTVTGLAEGINNITIAAKDGAQNITTITTSITYDSVAPAVTISSPIPGVTNNKTPLLNYAITGGTLSMVSVDGVIVSKTSGQNLDALADGSHTLRVEATDAAGNTGLAVVVFIVDTVAPAVAISAVSTPTNVSSQTITGTREENATVSVAVNTSASVGAISYFSATTWSCTVSNLASGTNTVMVAAADAAGNSATASADIIFDAVAPTVSITSPGGAPTNDNTPLLTYSVSDGSVVVKVDGVVVSRVSGDSLNTLIDGSHTVSVESTDAAGNTGFAQVTFMVDTTPPAISIDPVTTPTKNSSQTIMGTRESGASVSVTVNTSAAVGAVSYPSATTWSCTISNLVRGSNVITVRVVDAAGNDATAAATIKKT